MNFAPPRPYPLPVPSYVDDFSGLRAVYERLNERGVAHDQRRAAEQRTADLLDFARKQAAAGNAEAAALLASL